MSTIVTRNVIDLPETSRREVESLLGMPLQPDQRFWILVDAFYSSDPRRKPERSTKTQ